MATERVTLTDDYHHEEGRHFRAGDHVLPADIAAAARAAGKVETQPAKPARVRQPAAKKAAARKPAARKAARKPSKT